MLSIRFIRTAHQNVKASRNGQLNQVDRGMCRVKYHRLYLFNSSEKTFRVPPRLLFVRVETTDGLVGWGEATLEGHTEAVEGVFQEFRDRYTGWNADNIEDIWQHGYRSGFYRGGPVLMVSIVFENNLLQLSLLFIHISLLTISQQYLDSTLLSGISKAKSLVCPSGNYLVGKSATKSAYMAG